MDPIFGRPTRRLLVEASAVALIASGSVSLAAHHQRRTEEAAAAERQFWDALKVMGMESESYPTIREMASAADMVIRGRISGFRFSRQIQGDAAEDVVVYAIADLEVTESLRGQVRSRRIPLEFLIPQSLEVAHAVIGNLRTRTPEGEVIAFVRGKRFPNERGLYRLVNSGGLWTEEGGRLIAPLTEPAAATTPTAPAPPPSAAELVAGWHVENSARPAELRRDFPGIAALTPPATSPLKDSQRSDEETAAQRYAPELGGMAGLDDLAALVVQ